MADVAVEEGIFEITGGLLKPSGCVLRLRDLIDGKPWVSVGFTLEDALSAKPKKLADVDIQAELQKWVGN